MLFSSVSRTEHAAPRAAHAIELRGVSVAYGSHNVLDDVSLTLPNAQIIGLIGPNGAGKTTLLKTIVGAQRPSRGQVRVLGGTIEAVRQRVAYVPQRGDVDWSFPLTVLDVVLMGRYGRLGLLRRPSAIDRKLALEALDQVRLLKRAACQIGELSGGQQQRVFLARALVQQADLLLLDEPFNGIDTTTQSVIFDLLCEQRRQGRTVLLSTHDLHSVEQNCDQLVALNRRIIASGPVDEVFTAPVLQSTFGSRVAVVGDRALVVRP